MSPALRPNHTAFSRTELLVIVATVSLLALLLALSNASGRAAARKRQCVDNLKHIGLSFRQWSLDCGDRYTTQTASEEGGSLSSVTNGETFRHFQTMSNELNSPKVLVCPTDNRQSASDFSHSFSNSNLSYFVGVDADETQPQMWLTGDRNLTNGTPLRSGGIIVLTSNSMVGFNHLMHRRFGHVGLADGSVSSGNSQSIPTMLRSVGTNRLQFP